MSKSVVLQKCINKDYNPFAKKTHLIAFRADIETQFRIEVLRYQSMIEQGLITLHEVLRTAENRTEYKLN